MKTHGIPFRDDMAEAIRKGLKTQTRRLIEPQPVFSEHGCWYPGWTRNTAKRHYASEDHFRLGVVEDFCPWQVGDRIFVKERFRETGSAQQADGKLDKDYPLHAEQIIYAADGAWDGPWRQAKEMSAWAARTWLEITEIRAQRIREISEDDARAEGVAFIHPEQDEPKESGGTYFRPGRGAFRSLWESIYPGSWERNQFVFVLTYKRIAP